MNTMPSRKTLRRGLLLALAGTTLACGASQPPKELADARTAYQHAYNSQARQLTPAELHDARVSLQRAERAFSEDADTAKVRTYAYVATRKAQLAEIEAQTLDLQQRARLQEGTRAQQQAKEMAQTKEELEATRAQLSAQQQQLAAQRESIEKLVRMGAASSVREEGRGTVLTLSGTLLFQPGKSELRPQARTQLNQVADAIKEFGNKQVTAEGHTDSTGGEDLNMRLSQERADSVRGYLISRGVPEGQITAKGLGEAEPIADNKTAEGRAENRRVELIFQRAPGEMQQQTPGQPSSPQLQRTPPEPMQEQQEPAPYE
jgi:outer membrane protein OmpA-like peptidoglycan-associated protein